MGWKRFYDWETEALKRVAFAKAPLVPELGGELLLRWTRPRRILREGRPIVPLKFGDPVEAIRRRTQVLRDVVRRWRSQLR